MKFLTILISFLLIYCAKGELPTYFKDVEQVLLHRMNFSVDPCDDFYDYACGNSDSIIKPMQNENKRILENGLNKLLYSDDYETLKSSTAIIKALKYYGACITENVTEADMVANTKKEVELFMKKFNFPEDFFFDADANVKWDPKKLTQVLKYVHDAFFVEPFFSTFPVLHELLGLENINLTSHAFLGIKKVNATFEKTSYFCGPSNLLQNFTDGVYTVMRTMGLKAEPSQVTETAKELMELEFRLIGVSCSNKTVVEDKPSEVDLDSIGSNFTFLMKDLVVDLIKTGVGNNTFDYNNMSVVLFINSLPEVLTSVSQAELLRYMYFRIIMANAVPVNCVDILSSMPLAKSRIYTEFKYATLSEREELHSSITEIIKTVKQVFKTMVLTMPWIKKDRHAYDTLVKKFNKIRSDVAIEHDFLNNTWIDKYYKQINFDGSDSFLSMHSKARKFAMYGKVRTMLYNTTVNIETDMTEINAIYHKTNNKFVIYDGILIAPFYNKYYPLSFKLGNLAFIIGHEIGHSIDATGIMFNDKGLLKPFLSETAAKELKKMESCVVDQFNKIEVLPSNYTPHHVNGAKTLTENMADISGLAAAYRTFKIFEKKYGPEEPLSHPKLRELTRDQLFFLGFSELFCGKRSNDYIQWMVLNDEHTPDEARIQGLLPNVPEFGKAFDCPVGSKYRPAEHCKVWTH